MDADKQLRIVLLRHGRTSLSSWSWIRARELGRWIDAYNAAGIKGTPPGAAMSVARRCNVIVTSDLQRSVESGTVLGPKTPVISDGLFREAGMAYGSAAFIKMPPYVWAVLFRILWAFGFKANGEPIREFRERARRAAMNLISLARKHDAVLLVGHGLINSYIARELSAAGWQGPRRTRIRHWGHTTYTFDWKRGAQ